MEASTEVAAYHEGIQNGAAPSEQLGHLQTAIADLNKITMDFPSTIAAVKVVSLDESDDLYLPSLKDALKQTKRAAYCHDNPDDTTCQFDDLVEKHLSQVDPKKLDEMAQVLLFALAATQRYDDLFGLIRETGVNQNIPLGAGLPVVIFPAIYQDSDALQELDALNLERGRSRFRERDWAAIGRIPEIVRTKHNMEIPPKPPETELERRVARMFTLLQTGKNPEAQEEVRKIYILVRSQPTAAEGLQKAEAFLSQTQPQFKAWVEATDPT